MEATLRDAPLIVLLDDDRGDETKRGSVVGEDSDDVGAPLVLGVESFERVGRQDLLPVVRWKVTKRGEVFGGVQQHLVHDAELALHGGRDLLHLTFDVTGVGLGEDGADHGGDHLLVVPRDLHEDVANEVHLM